METLQIVFITQQTKGGAEKMVSNKSHREFTFTHWQLKGGITQVDPI